MRLAKTKVFIILGIFIALELLVLGLLFLNRDDNGEMAPFVYDGDYSNINISPINKTVTLKKGSKITLGALAKGNIAFNEKLNGKKFSCALQNIKMLHKKSTIRSI